MKDKQKTTLHNMVRAIDRQKQTVRRLNRGLSSVYETTRLLTSPMNLQQVLEIVVRTITEALGLDAAGLRLLEEETGTLVLKATYGLSEEYKNKGPVTAAESELNLRALRGEAIIVNDMRTDPHFKRYRAAVLREGVISSLSLGMMYKGKGIGILRLYSKRFRRFSQSDISLARAIAAQSAAAIVNARLYAEALEGERVARQVRLAGVVQRQLIPQEAPNIEGIELAGVYIPCYDVGGDFYDYIKLSDKQLVLSIGDVMGKGVPASLTMASLRSSLRAYAETAPSLAELIKRVNRMFCNDIGWGEFATLFCAKFDVDTSQLSYCNCGHEPPLLIRDKKVISLSEGGTVLGIEKDYQYKINKVNLQSGDFIVMYTDGLADAVNFERESFGRERIIQAALESIDLNARQIVKNIIWQMRRFTGLTRRVDDTAVVVLKKL